MIALFRLSLNRGSITSGVCDRDRLFRVRIVGVPGKISVIIDRHRPTIFSVEKLPLVFAWRKPVILDGSPVDAELFDPGNRVVFEVKFLCASSLMEFRVFNCLCDQMKIPLAILPDLSTHEVDREDQRVLTGGETKSAPNREEALLCGQGVWLESLAH